MVSLFGDFEPIQVLFSFLLLILFFAFFPRLMLMMSLSRINTSLNKMYHISVDSEKLFLARFKKGERKNAEKFLNRMKELVVVPPTSLDPSGIIKKLEHVLDTTEARMKMFIEQIAPRRNEEDKANLVMAYKGVYGAHQIFLIMRHIKTLVEKTKNFQLGSTIQMFLPMYEELSQSQKDATEAFVKGLPIGDSIGPMVASMFMTKKPKEIAEDIIFTQEKVNGKNLFILKSKGPGSRLGKYGDAVAKVAKENKLDRIITIDAGLRFEGEETGKVVEGIGVLMGGPGVEKTKIEEVASKNNIPLEGIVVKMNGLQASGIMRRKVYQGGIDAYNRLVENLKLDNSKNIMIVGVGNTVGVGNDSKESKKLPKLLKKYWRDQKEDEDSTMGLFGAFPFGRLQNQAALCGFRS